MPFYLSLITMGSIILFVSYAEILFLTALFAACDRRSGGRLSRSLFQWSRKQSLDTLLVYVSISAGVCLMLIFCALVKVFSDPTAPGRAMTVLIMLGILLLILDAGRTMLFFREFRSNAAKRLVEQEEDWPGEWEESE